MDPAESLDSLIDWWTLTGRKYFWGWVAGVWTMILAIESIRL